MISDSGQLAVFFSWLVQSSLQTCVLVCLVLATQVTLRNKLAPRWRYALWLLVVIRLALPWAPQSGLSVYNLVPFAGSESSAVTAGALPDDAAAASWPAAAASGHSPPLDDVALEPGGTTAGSQGAGADRIGGGANHVDVPARHEGYGWEALTRLIPLVWLLGAIAVAACASAQSIALAAAVRRQRFVTDQQTLDVLEDCKAELGVHRYLAVVETSQVSSPTLFGFIWPQVLLPLGAIESFGRHRLRHVFLHELVHLKRHDVALNWVMTLLQALHWFNPLVWYAFRRMRADREQACDASVLSRARPGESRQYGLTIVHLLERFSRRRRLPCLAGVLEDNTQIRRRIEMIARFKRASGPSSALAVVLLIVLASVTLTNAQQDSATSDINAQVARLDIDKATLDDVIRIFGEPDKYVWGKETFAKKDLPSRMRYIAVYGEGFSVYFRDGQIVELRHEDPDYLHRGRLRVGASLDDALKVIGKPSETVVGKQNEFKDGVLYRDINGRKGHGYYGRQDQDVRLWFSDDKVHAIYVTRSDYGEEKPQSRTADFDINALVAKLDVDKASLDDVIRVFGQPEKYVWGNETFTRDNLPRVYCMVYPNRFLVQMSGDGIGELRHHAPGYAYRGELQVGSSLDDVLEALGKPEKTLVGEENQFKDGVLYKDIDGRKGYCYYRRADQNVRLFFSDYKVSAVYVTRSPSDEEPAPKPLSPEEAKSIEAIRKGRPWIAETTTLGADGRLKDKVDYPFVADPDVVGTWRVVDFVREKKQFVPGKRWWRGDLDHLKGLRFEEDGTVAVRVADQDWSERAAKWTKGKVLHDPTASQYEITTAGGNAFLFYQWKSGDYKIRFRKPAYYVLQKE